MPKATSIIPPEMTAGAVKVYQSTNLAIIVDLRNPFITTQIHPEWRHPFVPAIQDSALHKALDTKLEHLGHLALYYSRILPKHEEVLEMCGLKKATVFVLSGIGEHDITPWLIIHNIGHTLISRHIKVKKEVIDVLGQKEDHFAIKPMQQKLVHCASSRKRMIPNINELINELFTTWVWYGKTQSGNKRLAKYCDSKFDALWKKHCNEMTYHRYRQPVKINEVSWLNDLIA